MSYVDVFCLPLPESNRAEYEAHAKLFARVMKEYGLERYTEALASDVPRGKVTDFYRAVQAEEGETVVVGVAFWPDKATRDRAWDEGMKDPRLGDMKPESMPFDGMRMFWGGFESFLEI